MSEQFRHRIEHLLDEADAPANPPQPDRLRARLAATLSEGIAKEAAARSSEAAPDAAQIAAFIDGQLTGASREDFLENLADAPALRADLESASELVRAAGEASTEIPAALLARARSQFAPSPAVGAAGLRTQWTSFFVDLLPRRRLAFALAAVLAVVVLPGALIVSGHFGGSSGQPELSGVEESTSPAPEKSQACKDKEAAEKAQKQAAAPKPQDAASKAEKDKDDPCAPDRAAAGQKK